MSGFRCLALETGGPAATVAACNGRRQCELALPERRKVAADLFERIDEVLDGVGLSLRSLDCIAFGKGPGAFTGLRIAAAAAQGLGAGLGLPLCPVSSLAALAQDALDQADAPFRSGQRFIAPALAAGRGEVYLGWYRAGDSGLVERQAEDRLAAAGSLHIPGAESFVAAGDAWAECAIEQPSRVAARAPDAGPRASAILRLALEEYRRGRCVAPEDAQPVYFREPV